MYVVVTVIGSVHNEVVVLFVDLVDFVGFEG